VTLFLMAAFIASHRATEIARPVRCSRLAVTIVAAVVQYFQVSVHPRYFNHNALYHAIQAAALFMICRGAGGTRCAHDSEAAA